MPLVKNKYFSHSIQILIVISLLVAFTLTGCDNFTETTPSTASNTSSGHTGAGEESNIILRIEDFDSNVVMKSLHEAGYQMTVIDSTGGLLRRGTSTLVAGVKDDQFDDAIN